MQQIKWTERQFTFGYDRGYVPLFIERLRGTAPRMEELLTAMGDAKATLQTGGGWSAKEHAGHLHDLETLHEGRIDDLLEGFSVLRAADMSNKDTYSASHNDRSVAELCTMFRDSRGRFIERLLALDGQYYERKALHPRLKQLITLTDLLFFIAEHDNHHLARIAGLAGGDVF